MSGLLSLPEPISGTPRSKGRRAGRRRGMSLLEVMIATVLVLGSVMALSRLAFLARRNAARAEDRTLSQIHCQNIMEEMLAGVRPLQKVPPTAFEGEAWVYMVDVEPLEQTGLAKVAVTVDRLEDPDGLLPGEDEMGGYRLVRWIRMGDHKLDMLDGPADGELDEPMDEPMDEPTDQPTDELDTIE